MPEIAIETEYKEVSQAELDAVKRLVQLLSNALKSLQIYPSTNPLPKEFRTKLYHGLSGFLEEHDELNLTIQPTQLLYEGKVVHQDGEKEKGVAYVLHKDGIRVLSFFKGLEPEEIEDLIKVMEICLRSTDLEEDLVTLCWESDFNHIKYLVVDDLLDVDVPSAEDIPDDWNFDQLYQTEVAANEKDEGLPKVDFDDSIRKQWEEQTRNLLKKLKEFSPEEVRNIKQLLEMDNRYRSLDQFIIILNGILLSEHNLSELEQMMQTMQRILITLVSMADFQSAAKVIWGLRRFEKAMKDLPEHADSLRQKKMELSGQVVDQAGEEENIKRVSQVLNDKDISEFAPVKEYLFSLNWNCISPMIHMFGDLKSYLARKMVCEVLVEKAKDHLELLGEGVTDKRWFVVRNVVSVLGAIGSEEGVRLLKQIAKHRDLRVRKEIVAALFKIPGEEAGELLTSFLLDEDKRIRILTSRGLAQKKEKQALPTLQTIFKDDEFRDLSADEKKHMLESFAVIGGTDVVPFLVKMVNKRSWLRRDKHTETRVFAIGALSLIDASQAEEALLQLSKKRNKAVRQACQHALRRIEYRRMRQDNDGISDS
jgi:HEAT repeat protein